MCGIAGYVNGGGRPAERGIVEAMTSRLAHRGPDGSGVVVLGPAALGHRRLSIIDVAGGAQPLANEDDTVWVSYNGEIYNDLDLRPRLEARGHVLRTASDTESLVHLYEDHGPQFVSRLNGMFALAIWDDRRRRLVLARDRMGQKPLYYATTRGGGIAFGSEPKAVVDHPEVGRGLDTASVARYLFYEYLPNPHSIWRGLKKLPPAHLLIWEDGDLKIERYWESPEPEAGSIEVRDREPTEAEAEGFWSAFREATARHRRSDVPLGVFLSGGVDSSCVAAALAEFEPAAGIRTFSIGFEDRSFDESSHARATAQFLGTEHHEKIFSAEDVLRLLPELATWFDEPFGDASILPTHLLSRFARESVTVALGGDGADELLAGYPTFGIERAATMFERLPRAARGAARSIAARLPVSYENFSVDFKIKQFLRGAGEAMPLAHQRWLGSFSGAEIASLLAEPPGIDVEAEHLARARSVEGSSPDRLTRSLRLYQATYLPEDILTKVDRASMACGLEVRAPFLDAELVDTIQRMPSMLKYGGRRTKRILKRAARGRVPDSVLERPKKGFGIPVGRWLRGPLGPWVDRLLDRDRLAREGLFRPDAVRRLVEDHRTGRVDNRKPIWTLLIFQLWREHWLGAG
ncbi:MAG: asparagine synthase (glutamine-hydrolyzing) [Isosphaeraceae bacterium]|nr:asparagine synthase (glutamine-hydrolyzing) [Isosphaeraceae bacterium]